MTASHISRSDVSGGKQMWLKNSTAPKWQGLGRPSPGEGSRRRNPGKARKGRRHPSVWGSCLPTSSWLTSGGDDRGGAGQIILPGGDAQVGGPQGKRETQWSPEGATFPFCPPICVSIGKATNCWQWPGSAEASGCHFLSH